MAYGNEPGGKNRDQYLTEFVNYWRKKDDRRVYTSGAGWPILDANEFHNIPKPRIQGWGQGLKSRVNASPFESYTDYTDIINQYPVPVVSHEIGQWCVFPNLDEIPKYDGVLKAGNFEIVRDFLREKQMLGQAKAFLLASGKLQALLYKEEIESALRTPSFAGFQLLQLHDFPGQGTALVGVLDPFWDEKGYITAKEYHEFSSETVPLLRMEKCVWTTDEIFSAQAEISHFGATGLSDQAVNWMILDETPAVLAQGTFTKDIPIGNAFKLGEIGFACNQVDAPQKLTIQLSVDGTEFENEWDIWVYPGDVNTIPDPDIIVVRQAGNLLERSLAAGRSVLFLSQPEQIDSDVPPGFSSIFWNTAWTDRQPPHTLGILCDPQHPVLASFPTEFHSNWQWWDLVTHSRAMILDELPGPVQPLVQLVDDWNTCRRLGLLFEAKIGKGKLLMSSMDLQTDLQNRPVARQMLSSILNYMTSDAFDPQTEIELTHVTGLLK
jgi:hypothetical protein